MCQLLILTANKAKDKLCDQQLTIIHSPRIDFKIHYVYLYRNYNFPVTVYFRYYLEGEHWLMQSGVRSALTGPGSGHGTGTGKKEERDRLLQERKEERKEEREEGRKEERKEGRKDRG